MDKQMHRKQTNQAGDTRRAEEGVVDRPANHPDVIPSLIKETRTVLFLSLCKNVHPSPTLIHFNPIKSVCLLGERLLEPDLNLLFML